eukprot:g5905.t1
MCLTHHTPNSDAKEHAHPKALDNEMTPDEIQEMYDIVFELADSGLKTAALHRTLYSSAAGERLGPEEESMASLEFVWRDVKSREGHPMTRVFRGVSSPAADGQPADGSQPGNVGGKGTGHHAGRAWPGWEGARHEGGGGHGGKVVGAEGARGAQGEGETRRRRR